VFTQGDTREWRALRLPLVGEMEGFVATIVHRRTIRPAPPTAAAEAWPPPPGPGARLGVLTVVGWVSLAGVVAWLVIS